MPLTSITKLYKTFPMSFAEKMTEQLKRRTESYKVNDMDDREVGETCARKPQTNSKAPSGEQRLMTKRSCTPLAAMSEGESDTENSPTSHPGKERRKKKSPTPLTSSLYDSTMNFIRWPRSTRQSPRTTVSLDRVDLWEESDSDSEGFDGGIQVNPCKTFDFSDLRRSQSPVACKRNKLEHETQWDLARSRAHAHSEAVQSESPVMSRKTKLPSITPEISLNGPIRHECGQSARSSNALNGPVNAVLLKQANQKRRCEERTSGRPASYPQHVATRTTPVRADHSIKTTPSNDFKTVARLPSSPPRRVKFNNLVTVRDGEESTLDFLRSPRDSAKRYKQKYLRGITRSESLDNPITDESVDQSSLEIRVC